MADDTVHSDWGDFLLREIESAEPAGLSLWYLGCNGFVVKASDGTTLFIDPYLGTGDPPRTVRMIPIPFDPMDVREADAVLATHEHTDHVDGPSQAPILAGTEATYYAPDDSLSRLTDEDWCGKYDLDGGRFTEVAENETIEIGGLTVHVEPAHDPDATHPVSYVIEHGGVTFFHGGDARPSSAFESIGEHYELDVGALAFGSTAMIRDKETRVPVRTTWYNDETQLIEAANQLRLGRLLPTHWDLWRGMSADPTALSAHSHSFPYPVSIEHIVIGDHVKVDR